MKGSLRLMGMRAKHEGFTVVDGDEQNMKGSLRLMGMRAKHEGFTVVDGDESKT